MSADERDRRFVTRSGTDSTTSQPFTVQRTAIATPAVQPGPIVAALTRRSPETALLPRPQPYLPLSVTRPCSQSVLRPTARRRSPLQLASGAKCPPPLTSTFSIARPSSSADQPTGSLSYPVFFEAAIGGGDNPRTTPDIASAQTLQVFGSRVSSQPLSPPLLSPSSQMSTTQVSFIPPGQIAFYQRSLPSRLMQMPFYSRTAAEELIRISLLRSAASYQQQCPSYLDALSRSATSFEPMTSMISQVGGQQHLSHPLYVSMFAEKKPRIDSPSHHPYHYHHTRHLPSSPSLPMSQDRGGGASAAAGSSLPHKSSSLSSSKGSRPASPYISPARASTSSPLMSQSRRTLTGAVTSHYGEERYSVCQTSSSSSLHHGRHFQQISQSRSPTFQGAMFHNPPVEQAPVPLVGVHSSADTRHQPPHYPAHFVRGSVVQLASGRLKRVEELETADFVESAGISESLRIDTSTVDFLRENHEHNTVILGFSVGERRIQVTVEATLEHPFFVFDQGWSSYSPERTLHRYGLHCQQLAIGDRCISITQKDFQAPPSASTLSSTESPRAPSSKDSQTDVQKDTGRGTNRDAQRERHRDTCRDSKGEDLQTSHNIMNMDCDIVMCTQSDVEREMPANVHKFFDIQRSTTSECTAPKDTHGRSERKRNRERKRLKTNEKLFYKDMQTETKNITRSIISMGEQKSVDRDCFALQRTPISLSDTDEMHNTTQTQLFGIKSPSAFAQCAPLTEIRPISSASVVNNRQSDIGALRGSIQADPYTNKIDNTAIVTSERTYAEIDTISCTQNVSQKSRGDKSLTTSSSPITFQLHQPILVLPYRSDLSSLERTVSSRRKRYSSAPSSVPTWNNIAHPNTQHVSGNIEQDICVKTSDSNSKEKIKTLCNTSDKLTKYVKACTVGLLTSSECGQCRRGRNQRPTLAT